MSGKEHRKNPDYNRLFQFRPIASRKIIQLLEDKMYLRVLHVMNESLACIYWAPIICQALKIDLRGRKVDLVLNLGKLTECLLGETLYNDTYCAIISKTTSMIRHIVQLLAKPVKEYLTKSGRETLMREDWLSMLRPEECLGGSLVERSLEKPFWQKEWQMRREDAWIEAFPEAGAERGSPARLYWESI